MTVKELDQFLCDYVHGQIVEVDASWLQQQLREAESNRRLIRILQEKIALLSLYDRSNHIYLNVRA